MNARQIQKKLRTLLRRRASDKLARLPEEIRQHAEGGLTPMDPIARAYVELTQAAIGAMDSSIGGGAEHDAARRAFQEKYEAWQKVLQEAEL